jgi:hypothetical protein
MMKCMRACVVCIYMMVVCVYDDDEEDSEWRRHRHTLARLQDGDGI